VRYTKRLECRRSSDRRCYFESAPDFGGQFVTERAEPKYDRMATGAAWTAFEAPHVGGDLCCGLAGRSYALLNLYKHSGDLVWLDRARRLAESAAASIKANSQASDGLYHGRVGVVLLAADLECPHRSCMPLFEPES